MTAVNENNITRAADILHITQPTLSRQLMELERELGTTLFIRGKRSLDLTDDGIIFKQRAEEIVELTERAEREFLEKDRISGVIVIGASEAKGSLILAKMMKQFADRYPLTPGVPYDPTSLFFIITWQKADYKEPLDFINHIPQDSKTHRFLKSPRTVSLSPYLDFRHHIPQATHPIQVQPAVRLPHHG